MVMENKKTRKEQYFFFHERHLTNCAEERRNERPKEIVFS
jgi:hypothetical protein